jgi:hypothetical protein
MMFSDLVSGNVYEIKADFYIQVSSKPSYSVVDLTVTNCCNVTNLFRKHSDRRRAAVLVETVVVSNVNEIFCW